MVKPTDVKVEVMGVFPRVSQEERHYEVEFKIQVSGQREFHVFVTCSSDTNLFDQAVYDALGSLLGIGRGITEQAGDMKTELRSRTPGIQRTL